MGFSDWFWKVSSSNGLVLLDRGKKYHAACVLVCISCLTSIINEQSVKDKAIVSFLEIFHQRGLLLAGNKTTRNLF